MLGQGPFFAFIPSATEGDSPSANFRHSVTLRCFLHICRDCTYIDFVKCPCNGFNR